MLDCRQPRCQKRTLQLDVHLPGHLRDCCCVCVCLVWWLWKILFLKITCACTPSDEDLHDANYYSTCCIMQIFSEVITFPIQHKGLFTYSISHVHICAFYFLSKKGIFVCYSYVLKIYVRYLAGVLFMKTVDNQLTHHGQELKLQRVTRTEANDFFRRATPAVLLLPPLLVRWSSFLLYDWHRL